MNKYITFTLVLFASAALGSCGGGYGAGAGYGGPAIQQLSLGAIPNIEHILNGASSAYGGPSPSLIANAGPAASVSYAPSQAAYAAPALAPATSIVLPSQNAYGAAVPSGYGAPSRGYGAAPRLAIQPAVSTQLYPGQQNYKAYVSPAQRSRVALPILPAEPVAKLYLPQQSDYATAAHQGAHTASY